jgi:hypothetical protein
LRVVHASGQGQPALHATETTGGPVDGVSALPHRTPPGPHWSFPAPLRSRPTGGPGPRSIGAPPPISAWDLAGRAAGSERLRGGGGGQGRRGPSRPPRSRRSPSRRR